MVPLCESSDVFGLPMEETRMHIKDWKKEIFTIPNLLSLIRLVMIPFYMMIYLNATEVYEFITAAAIMTSSCITDLLDGMIARRFHMVSTLGKILDPLADKVTQLALTLCLSLRYPMLHPMLGFFLVKELFQLIMGYLYLRKGKMLPGALMAGKICTAILFISPIGLVLFPAVDPVAVRLIALTDTAFLTVSFISYIAAYFGKNTKVQDLDPQ